MKIQCYECKALHDEKYAVIISTVNDLGMGSFYFICHKCYWRGVKDGMGKRE